MWMIGFWIAPSRDSAKLATTVSMRVGSTQVTGVPSPMPSSWNPAATASTSARNASHVNDRPASSINRSRSGVAATRSVNSPQNDVASSNGAAITNPLRSTAP